MEYSNGPPIPLPLVPMLLTRVEFGPKGFDCVVSDGGRDLLGHADKPFSLKLFRSHKPLVTFTGGRSHPLGGIMLSGPKFVVTGPIVTQTVWVVVGGNPGSTGQGSRDSSLRFRMSDRPLGPSSLQLIITC